MKLWDEAEVGAALRLPQVIDSLEQVLTHEAAGTAWNLDKTMATWPAGDARGSAHALGAVDRDDELAVFKTWVNTPLGATALMTIFSTVDGSARGLAEAGVAGALRQVEAVAAVRPLRRVRVWNRTAANAEALAAQVRDQLGLDAVVASSVLDATEDAPIVTLITRAAEPFLRPEHLARGAHLNAVGAILPTHAEFHHELLDGAGLVVVDSEPNARRGSRELREHYGPDEWSAVHQLADVVTGKVTRPDPARPTVFKGMGMGLSDLAVARLLIGGTS